MSNLKLFTFNLVVQPETVITAASENSLFPASNIKDPRTTKVHRTETSTLSNSIVFDMVTIEQVDAVMVIPNFKTGFSGISGDITIEANSTDNWSSPSLSTTMTPNDSFGLAYKFWTSVQEYRFWRLSFSNTQDYAEISKVFIGVDAMRSITQNNIDFGWTKQPSDMSTFRRNRYKQRFVDEIGFQDIYKFSYKLLNAAEYDALVNGLEEVGETTPFWMMVDSSASIITDEERFAGCFYLNSMPTITNRAFGLYDLSISAEQCL